MIIPGKRIWKLNQVVQSNILNLGGITMECRRCKSKKIVKHKENKLWMYCRECCNSWPSVELIDMVREGKIYEHRIR